MIRATTRSSPFGGAGPLHAAPIAEELGIKTIVMPPSAGMISAYGLIASDFVMFESLTRRERAGPDAADLVRSVFAEMRERATGRAKAIGLSGSLRLEFTADMRFVGQAFEVPVTFSDDEIDGLSAETVRQRFLDAHDRIYFFGKDSDKPIEFVSFRLGVIVPLGELPLLTESATGAVAGRPDPHLRRSRMARRRAEKPIGDAPGHVDPGAGAARRSNLDAAGSGGLDGAAGIRPTTPY